MLRDSFEPANPTLSDLHGDAGCGFHTTADDYVPTADDLMDMASAMSDLYCDPAEFVQGLTPSDGDDDTPPPAAPALPVAFLAVEFEARPGDWWCVALVDPVINGEPVSDAAAIEIVSDQCPTAWVLVGDATVRVRPIAA